MNKIWRKELRSSVKKLVDEWLYRSDIWKLPFWNYSRMSILWMYRLIKFLHNMWSPTQNEVSCRPHTKPPLRTGIQDLNRQPKNQTNKDWNGEVREREMAGRNCYRDVLPFSAMVAVECTNVGVNVLFKAATQKGLSYFVFIAYSFAVSTLVLLLPLPFVFRWYCCIACSFAYLYCMFIPNSSL